MGSGGGLRCHAGGGVAFRERQAKGDRAVRAATPGLLAAPRGSILAVVCADSGAGGAAAREGVDRPAGALRPLQASMSQRWHLLAYDVRDDRRLRRTAKLLEGYGERLQYSVFRCKLSDRQLERLRWKLSRELATEDSLLIVPLCDACVSRLV